MNGKVLKSSSAIGAWTNEKVMKSSSAIGLTVVRVPCVRLK
jgi:hypothetical protein